MIDAARERGRDQIKVILASNRLDCRIRGGRQLVEELSEFGEIVVPHCQWFGIRPLFHRRSVRRKFRAGRCRGPGNPATRRRSRMGCATRNSGTTVLAI